jgi:hypothetical protein
VLLVHGVLRDDDRDVLDRYRPDDGPRPRAVSAGALAAVVSDAPTEELTAEDAVAHLDLLVALVTEVPVLPLPLGTAVPDDDAVRRDVLTAEADRLARQLAATADVVELRVDLRFDTDAAVAAIAQGDPELHRMAERTRVPGAGLAERMALGEAVAERLAETETALTDEWTGELESLAERSAVLHADEEMRQIAYLVKRDRLEHADAAVGRMRDLIEDRAEVEYVGPLPVYSFLDDLDVAAQPQPTSRWGW